MVVSDLPLDRNVRDWVFIPLTLSILLMNLIRQFATKWMNSGSDEGVKPISMQEVLEQQAIIRAARWRRNDGLLPRSSYLSRKAYFAAPEKGLFTKAPKFRSPNEMMMGDPGQMSGMFKKQLTGMVPQLAMGAWVNSFFDGFVIGKMPFPLSPRFKLMLQRGIDLQSLDPSYFTGLSFYVLLLFGLRGALSLVFHDEVIDETAMMQRQMNPMAGAAPSFDAIKAFEAERARFDIHEHKSRVADAETKATELLRRNLAERGM